jgi:glutamate:GABA antiporter
LKPLEKDAKRKPALFLRDATGLRKNISLTQSILINLGYLTTGSLLGIIGLYTVLSPSLAGVNLALDGLLAFLMVVPEIFVYYYLIARMPRTGGDYIWVSRSLNGFVGGAGALALIILPFLPYLALITIETVFSIGSVGVSLGNLNFLNLAVPASNLTGSISQMAVGGVILGVLILINVLSPKLAFRFMAIVTAIVIPVTIISILVLFYGGTAGINNYLGSLGNPNLTMSAVAAGYPGTPSSTFTTIVNYFQFVPVFILISFTYMNMTASVASEIQYKKNRISWNIPISVGIGVALFIVALATMYYVGGIAFVNGALTNPTLIYTYGFNFYTLTMGTTTNSALIIIVGLGWIIWNVLALLGGIITVSRYFLAQAFDRVLPERFAYVSSTGSPVVAHLVDFVITMSLVVIATLFYSTLVGLYGSTISGMVWFAIIGVAATVYGLRKEKNSRVRNILIPAGILMTIVFLFIVYEMLVFPSVWGLTALSESYSIAALIVGIVVYLAARQRLAKKGLQIDATFKEIPPE